MSLAMRSYSEYIIKKIRDIESINCYSVEEMKDLIIYIIWESYDEWDK